MKIILLWFLFITFATYAQVPLEKTTPALKEKLSSISENTKVLVWVFFKDKGNKLSKFYAAPSRVVSELSLKRRAKTRSKASLIDFTDLPVNNEYVSGLQKQGFELRHITRWFNGASGYIEKKDLNNILNLPFVKKADIVMQYKKSPEAKKPVAILNKNYFQPNQPNSLNYGPSYTQDEQINIPALHQLGYTGQGVTICLMDDGVTLLSHQAFSSMHILATYDFVNNRVYIGDGEGGMGLGIHGTETLSCIGGYLPGELIGPAYGANYLIAKTENSQSTTPVEEDNWVAAMEWADSIGVDITSSSLTHLYYDAPYQSYDYFWYNMDGHTSKITLGCLMAARKGIVVVNSAGNNGYNAVHNTLGVPADADSIITTGADSSNGLRADFSSVGPTADGRIKPDVMAMGVNVVVANPSNSTSTTLNDGTSFSCPLTAGVCALLLQKNPALTNMQIIDAIRNTASNHSSPNNLIGWGLVDALGAANYNAPLPVELSSFNSNIFGREIQLKWETKTEKNSAEFQIECSLSGESNWTNIGTVQAAGLSNSPKEYSFTDNNLQPGKYQFRIKMIDNDGTFVYSDVIEADISLPKKFELSQNYPNPFNPTTRINYQLPVDSRVTFEIFNITGERVAELVNGDESAGDYTLDVRANGNGINLTSGVYIYRINAIEKASGIMHSSSKKMILLK